MAGNKYLRHDTATGYPKETAGTQVSAGGANANEIPALDATGKLDVSLMPTGIGPVTQVVVASEALAAGDFVNLYNNAGVLNARKADASTTKEAHGFVLAAVSNGGNATVYSDDQNTSVTGLTPGMQFLSDTTPGKCTTTVAAGAGHIVQRLGVASAAAAMEFAPQSPYQLS